MAEEQNLGAEKVCKEFLFVGSPLLDITSYCSQEILDRYGLKSDDCIREKEGQEALFRSLLIDPESRISAGGSSQNTARIAKWVLGEKGRVSFAGCVGMDDYATTMQECLRSEGVEPLYIPLQDESTGICACLLSSEGDERSMCARLGAAAHIAAPHLRDERIRGRLATTDCVFVEGYVFSHSPDVMSALAEGCLDDQVFAISLSAEYICRDYGQPLLKVLPRVDILLSNEAEAKVLGQSLELGDVTVEDIARILATKDRPTKYKPRIVVVTRGPNPVLVVRGAGPPLFFPVPSGVQVKDSVGCGDAMAGAFLAVYLLNGDVHQATRTGISAATEIAQVFGCNPTRKRFYP